MNPGRIRLLGKLSASGRQNALGGTNENTNGLIRDFYPKGTNFSHVTDQELAETERLLNIRPRQTLAFRSPAYKLNQLINGVALAN